MFVVLLQKVVEHIIHYFTVTWRTFRRQLSWKTESDDDVSPTPLKFLPARKPGVKLSSGDDRTPLDFFKLFFSDDAVETLCRNTNKRAARSTAGWTDVGAAEFYSYIGLIFYMSMVKLKNTAAFWRENSIFTVPFPLQVMSRDRYQALSWNVHMSDPDEERINDAKTGTSEHDRLFRVKPLMETIQKAHGKFGVVGSADSVLRNTTQNNEVVQEALPSLLRRLFD